MSSSAGDGVALRRTLRALYHPHNRYVVHLDLKAPAAERAELAAALRADPVYARFRNVKVVTRANLVTYRGPTMVANTLHAAAILLRDAGDWDWFINLSASDYPLVSQDGKRQMRSAPPHPNLRDSIDRANTPVPIQISRADLCCRFGQDRIQVAPTRGYWDFQIGSGGSGRKVGVKDVIFIRFQCLVGLVNLLMPSFSYWIGDLVRLITSARSRWYMGKATSWAYSLSFDRCFCCSLLPGPKSCFAFPLSIYSHM